MQIGHQIVDNFAEQMVDEGLVSKDQLTVARVSQQTLGEDLGHILIKKGFVTEEQLLSFMGKALSIPFISLRTIAVPPELVQRIPLHLARRYHAIPVREEGDAVVIAMSNPMDRSAIDDIRAALHDEIRPVLASMEEIDRLIESSYKVQRLEKGKPSERIEVMAFSFDEGGDTTGEKLEKIATGPKIVQTVTNLIVQAYQEKASDIHIEPSADRIRIRYRIDGLLEEKQRLPREMHLPVVSRIKIMGGLDIAERRIPQDGRVRIRIGGIALDLRVSTCPTLYGEKVVLRLLSKDAVIDIESLGFSEKERKIFTELVTRSHGIFLVTGPTGSGKSTTLYAALSRINSTDKNIISVEDPVESEVPGVNQSQINLKAGVTFASALRSILRQDPDVIMIGEIRDGETSEIAVRAAITGHLVLSTLHTNTAAGAVSRLVDLGVPPFLIASSLIGVLAQRLVRKICSHCRFEVEPDAARAGTAADRVRHFFQGQGCSACRMSGYSGRIGIFELFPMTDSVRKLIAEKGSDRQIEEELRKGGVKSILDDGLEKVDRGITTIDEVLRVTQET